ncbi:hypothetical protein F4805DRAFT_388812 [Annulohypoxylon moriforme]|nr:hypothetical protein F4805DRAFT_388812 [Annulohypoxylon moriforme]
MDKYESSQLENQQQAVVIDKKERVFHKPQWNAVLGLLSRYLDKAAVEVRESGRKMTAEEHNSYYQAIFNKLREELASRDDIPNAIMEKPTKELTLTFYGKWNEPICIGCVDFHETSDIIHVEIHAKEDEPDGVTKDDLVRRICEVAYTGLRVYGKSNRELSIILSSFDWMGTTTLCNLADGILYIGYEPVIQASSTKTEKDGLEREYDSNERYEITWDPKALGPGASSYQGYDATYAKKLMVVKGWNPEDLDASIAF